MPNGFVLPFRLAQSLALALLVLCGVLVTSSTSHAQGESAVTVGFDGNSRLGSWFPIFVTAEDGANELPDELSYEIDSVDADGFPVSITGTARRNINGQYECLMQSGRQHGPRRVRLLRDQKEVFAAEFMLQGSSAKHEIHPATVGLTVVLEPTPRIANVLATKNRSEFVLSLPAAAPIPSTWLGWQAVETLVIATSDLDYLESLSDEQWRAMETWLNRGGRLVVAASPTASELLVADGLLARFCPGTFTGTAEIKTSSRIEFFADASEQLIARDGTPINVCPMSDVQGRVELTQESQALIVSAARVFGELVFVGIDLQDSRLEDWSGYSELVKRIVRPVMSTERPAKRNRNSNQGSQVSHVGYTDLTGQLRLTLDRFPSVPFVSFASIAVLIGLYLLLIGPGDYYFLRKIVGHMELTWLTFPLITGLFCGGAMLAAHWTRPSTVRLNQLEIIDIDADSQTARSNIWTHFYSPNSGQCSIGLPKETSLEIAPHDQVLSWQGLPGDGLGGMSTRAGNSLVGQSYLQKIDGLSSRSDDSALVVQIKNQPLRVSTTRSLHGNWWSKLQSPPASNLRLNRRTKHIEGTFTNPLNAPLKNVKLLFEDYLYTVEGTLGAGEPIDILGDDLDEQTTRSFFNRRKKDKDDANKARNLPWNPTSTRLDRLAEILMFYSAAGGNEYVGLSHSYQPWTDLSNHLHLSRAILVGELDSVATPLEINGDASHEAYDSTTAIVRIIFPVKTR